MIVFPLVLLLGHAECYSPRPPRASDANSGTRLLRPGHPCQLPLEYTPRMRRPTSASLDVRDTHLATTCIMAELVADPIEA